MSVVNIIGWKMDLHTMHKGMQINKYINYLLCVFFFFVQSYKLVLVVTRKREGKKADRIVEERKRQFTALKPCNI
jgi:predicted tellurium resistance membrane protein TerC